jgi:[acyl-carrier-protein] S-malonyltransferase
MSTIAVFPGQGAQIVGMGQALHRHLPASRAVFAEVDEALGASLTELIFNGPADELTLTENAQPALMATSLAAVRAVEARCGQPLARLVDYVAGHSLGEYSALAAAGALGIADAARLLRLRGQAMQRAVAPGEGAMAAILGLAPEAVAGLAREAAGPGEPCDFANDNADGQAVVSGATAAVGRAIELAKSAGAKRAIPLDVSAPFHCSLMAPAAAELAVALERTPFAAPGVPLIANVTADVVADPTLFPKLLTRQVTARVRWRESSLRMVELGVDLVIEFGAGRVLSGLAKRALPGARVVAVHTPEEAEAAANLLLERG